MTNPKRDDWLVIGISGVTCGGKTTLANKLKEVLIPSYVFHQDKYFFPDDSPRHVKVKGLDHNNYDILSSLDMEQMYHDVLSTINGDNKAHHTNFDRTSDKLEIIGKKILIMEGFTVLNYKPILDLCHLKYYLVLEVGECQARRCFRLYEPPDVPGYFEQCVWPEHVRYRDEIMKEKSVTMLDGARPDAFDFVISDLQQWGATRATPSTPPTRC